MTRNCCFGTATTGAVSLAGMMTGISAFVAVFIVASTFAFTVAQRRRDLALLRLIGASRRQVRRLMFGEALVLGTIGSSVGILLGVLIAPVEVRLLARPGLVPADFHAEWRSWIVAVSLAVGIGISVAGSFGAARRAARVRPLEGLHAVSGDRVMTVSRWAIGLIASAGVVAMIAAATSMGGTGAMNMSVGIALVAVIALSALSPTVVPLVNRLVPGVLATAVPAEPTGRARARERRGRRTTQRLDSRTHHLAGRARRRDGRRDRRHHSRGRAGG